MSAGGPTPPVPLPAPHAAPLPAPRILSDGVVTLRLLAPLDAPAVAAAVPAGQPGAWEGTPGPYSLTKARGIVDYWEKGRLLGRRLSLVVLAGAHGAEAPGGASAGETVSPVAAPAPGRDELAGALVFEAGAPAAKERADLPGQLECGYWIRPEARGNGYAARALALASAWALSLPQVSRVWLEIERSHAASRRVAARASFRLCGVRWRRLGATPPGDVLIYDRRA